MAAASGSAEMGQPDFVFCTRAKNAELIPEKTKGIGIHAQTSFGILVAIRFMWP
jgi:hypothetical protein